MYPILTLHIAQPNLNLNCISNIYPNLLVPQVTEVKELEGRLYALLEVTPPSGKQFTAAIKAALKNETWWVDWKKAGCVVAPDVTFFQPPPEQLVTGACSQLPRRHAYCLASLVIVMVCCLSQVRAAQLRAGMHTVCRLDP